ncbi:MAG TPA: hypothetical protein VK447_02685 [Myxococcaceae bacterium]|nr:hypothetical protein [Myxococcaceae bacterium]
MKHVSMIVLLAGLGLLAPTSALAVDCNDDARSSTWSDDEIATCAAEAEAWVRLKLQHAQTILERMISKNPAKYDAKDKAVRDALAEYLKLQPADYKLWLGVLVDEIKKLRALRNVKLVPPDGEGNQCANSPGTEAYTDRETNTIYLCSEWRDWRLACRRQVMMHEFFHLAGHEDFYKRPGFSEGAVLSRFKDAGFVATAVTTIVKERPFREIPTAESCTDVNIPNLLRK